jgi:hypothetical protein
MRALIVVVLLLAACGPTTSGPVGAASAASPASSARSSAAATPEASAPPPAAVVLGACRLPVSVSGSQPTVGWLQLPSGSYSPDPTSAAHMSSVNSMIAWDSATGAWVPTDPPYLSPDGTRFVAPITSSTIDVVETRTGAILAAIPTQNQDINTVIGYTQQGVYLVATGQTPPPGLWKIDTASWKFSQVSSDSINWEIVDDTAAWGTSTSHTGVVERLDLSSGVITNVLPTGPDDLQVSGFVGAGVLVVNGSGPLKAAQIVNLDGSTRQVDVPAPLNGAVVGGWTFQEGGEILFPSTAGLFAFDADHSFQEVAANPDVFRVLGACSVP